MGYIESMFSLEGRTAVVTGGAGGIPSVLALAFAEAGAKVCIWGRGAGHPIPDAVAALREKLPAGARLEGLTVDTGDRDSVLAAIAETEKLLGVPDILVNGVGGNMGKAPFVDADEAKFVDILKLNLMAGLVTPTRAFAQYWIERGVPGDVINMTSMTSYKALSGTWAYGAAKAGVLNLNEALARELAPKGIRVNAIAPGFFVGNQNRSLLLDEQGGLTARGAAIVARTPMGRFGEMKELCGAALFLASRPASAFITGVSLPVDGGYLTDNI